MAPVDAKKYLQQVSKWNKIIENKTVEIEQWKLLAGSSTSGSGESVKIGKELHNMERVQSSGNPQKMENAVVNYTDMEEELLKDRETYARKKQEVVAMIELLPSAEYDILHKMYIGIVEKDEKGNEFIKYLLLEDIANLYQKSYSWTTMIHGKALKMVQNMLDGREKENGKFKQTAQEIRS